MTEQSVWRWRDTEAPSLEAMEREIADHCVEEIANRNPGPIIAPDGTKHGFIITVQSFPSDVGDLYAVSHISENCTCVHGGEQDAVIDPDCPIHGEEDFSDVELRFDVEAIDDAVQILMNVGDDDMALIERLRALREACEEHELDDISMAAVQIATARQYADIMDAVRALLSDIDDMSGRQGLSDNWFGAFSHFVVTGRGMDEFVDIEWPNLAISAARVRELLATRSEITSRFQPELTASSRIAVPVVVDTESDNDDSMVEIDPDRILTDESRTHLAEIVAAALCVASFEPRYEDV